MCNEPTAELIRSGGPTGTLSTRILLIEHDRASVIEHVIEEGVPGQYFAILHGRCVSSVCVPLQLQLQLITSTTGDTSSAACLRNGEPIPLVMSSF